MARTHQSGRGRGPGAGTSKRKGVSRPVKIPASRKKQKSRTAGIWSRILWAFGIALLCIFVAGLAFGAGGYLGIVHGVKQLEAPQNFETHPTYLYSAPLGESDSSRRVIGTIFSGENRKAASLADMPPHLLNALVAKEDERFREHAGVDLWGIMRALYVDLRAGATVEGASTITQQYVKNAYLSHDQSITRKVKEALIAVELERSVYKDNKDQVIADYLNTVYFGSNAYGVQAASETFFRKSAADLSVAESATLVGLLWSPSTLGQDREGAWAQRDLGLRKMFETGYISSQDYNEALEVPMPEEWPAGAMVESGLQGPSTTRSFTDLAEEELIARYGANTVLQGGMSVYTTIDLQTQVAAQEILYGPDGYLPNADDPDLALVSLDPETGRITAMVGNRDPDAQFNLVTQGQRQPGSAFKPFALIAALEQGIDPETEFVSEKKEYMVDVPGLEKPEKWKVENYDGIVRGEIPLKEALWWSDNTVFTDLVMNADGNGLENGPAAIIDVAKRLGVTADFGPHPHPSVVLGTQEISPLDLATAYATIANEGRRVEPTTITKVVSNGQEGDEVLYDAPEEPRGEQVIEEDVAHKATELMIGDVTEGIAKDASLGERPVAGKTGTSENFFDAWFVGYVPQMVTGIWMGYGEGGATLEYTLDYSRKLNGLSGGITPAEVWKTYMEDAMAGQPVEDFEGVEIPEEPKETTTGPSDAPPTGATEQPGLAPGAETTAPVMTAPVTTASPPPEGPGAIPQTTSSAPPASAEPNSAGPASPAPSSTEPSAVTPASVPAASPAPR
ncbi:MAG: transglycosylase domain-containing protein [Actinomycetota bacterium]|nr:transglycosylase domain-containing protein [Actinomycetota bacterium]